MSTDEYYVYFKKYASRLDLVAKIENFYKGGVVAVVLDRLTRLTVGDYVFGDRMLYLLKNREAKLEEVWVRINALPAIDRIAAWRDTIKRILRPCPTLVPANFWRGFSFAGTKNSR